MIDRAAITGLLLCPLCQNYSVSERDTFKTHVTTCHGHAMEQDLKSPDAPAVAEDTELQPPSPSMYFICMSSIF